MSPTLRIDPASVRSLARVVERTVDDVDGIVAVIGTAQRDSALTADGPTRLHTVHETLALVARILPLRADLADGFTIDPARLRQAEELSMAEFDLSALLSAPADAQADRLIAALDAAGPLTPADLLDADRLRQATAGEADVAAALREIAAHRDDPAYLHDVFARLGPDRMRQLLALTNAYGYAHDVGLLDADAFADVLQPLAVSLGAAERAGTLPADVEAALLDLGPGDPDDPRFERLSADEYDVATDELEVRRRMLALLVHEGGFSSSFRADAVAQVVRTPSSVDLWTHEGFLSTDGMSLTALVALRSLVGDDDAMHAFVTMDANGDGWYENAALLTQIAKFDEYAVNDAAGASGRDPRDIRDDLVTVSSTVLERGLLVAPAAAGTTYGRDELGAFSTVVLAAGRGDVDRLKRTVAAVATPYTRDLAVAYDASVERSLGGPSGLHDVDKKDVARFMQELSYDQEALARMSANGTAFMVSAMKAHIPDFIAHDPTAFLPEQLGAGAYFGALGDGIDRANIDKTEAREALVNGFRMVSDPLVGLAVGKLPGADLPVVSGVADKVTDSLSDTIYGKLIPMPELEDLDLWHTTLLVESEDAFYALAWSDPELRVAFGGPDDAAMADLNRADPAIVTAIREKVFMPNVRPAAALMRMAIDVGILSNKAFKWSEG